MKTNVAFSNMTIQRKDRCSLALGCQIWIPRSESDWLKIPGFLKSRPSPVNWCIDRSLCDKIIKIGTNDYYHV